MRVSFSKSDREGLSNCCGRKPFVQVLLDAEGKFRRTFYIVCPVCSSSVSGDTFSLAKSDWNVSLAIDNDFMDGVRSLKNEGSN